MGLKKHTEATFTEQTCHRYPDVGQVCDGTGSKRHQGGLGYVEVGDPWKGAGLGGTVWGRDAAEGAKELRTLDSEGIYALRPLLVYAVLPTCTFLPESCPSG